MKLIKPFAVILSLFIFAGSAMAQQVPKVPIVLKGAPMGAVKFDHTSHLKVAGKCEVCHHASSRPRR